MCPVTRGWPSPTSCAAFGVDERGTRHLFAARRYRVQHFARLLVAYDLARGFYLDERIGAAGLEEDAMQVAAMDDGVRIFLNRF